MVCAKANFWKEIHMKNGDQNRSQAHVARAEFWIGHKISLLISRQGGGYQANIVSELMWTDFF